MTHSHIFFLLPIEYSISESNPHKEQRHATQIYARSVLENTRCDDCLPRLLRRETFSFSPFTCIKSFTSTQTTIQLSNSIISATATKNKDHLKMIACSQPVDLLPQVENKDHSNIFLTNAELVAYMKQSNTNMLIIDCGSSLRYNERKILGSLSLNINDKISRKRFASRGLKNFLDQDQLNLLERTEIIILYDDSIRPSACATTNLSFQISPAMKCVQDELKKYNPNKPVYILQSPFDDFSKHYPHFCVTSEATNQDPSLVAPLTCQAVDIDMYEMSEILPGLFLGNARDAQDKALLSQKHIQTVINVSSNIPCHFASENLFEYYQLPCEDSNNQSILEYFDRTFQLIHERLTSQQHLLVHCQGGVSRSPSFVIGYIMKYHSKTFDQAYQWVKSKRTIINPNLNFVGQLSEYQRTLTRSE